MRLEGIDILRGLAVTLVVLYHFFELLGLQHHILYPYISSIGQLGVPLFFIISGYLIYRSVDYSISRHGMKSGLKQYFSHRIFRILPAYYFNFIIVFILAFYVFDTMSTWPSSFIEKQIYAHLTFSSFFIYKTSGLGINGAYWTLSIEMLWYIVVPFLYIYIKKDRYFILLFILSILYLLALDFSLFNTILNIDKSDPNYLALLFYWSFQLPGQLIYFIAGIFIYKYSEGKIFIPRYVQYLLFLFIMLLFTYLSTQKYFLNSFTIKNAITLMATTSLFIVFYRLERKELHLLAWIGKISYSLYLWHMPLLFLMQKYMPLTSFSLVWVSVVFLVLFLIISSLSYYLVEEYGFTLRKRFEKYQIPKFKL